MTDKLRAYYIGRVRRAIRRLLSLEEKMEALAERSPDVRRFLAMQEVRRRVERDLPHAESALATHIVESEERSEEKEKS